MDAKAFADDARKVSSGEQPPTSAAHLRGEPVDNAAAASAACAFDNGTMQPAAARTFDDRETQPDAARPFAEPAALRALDGTLQPATARAPDDETTRPVAAPTGRPVLAANRLTVAALRRATPVRMWGGKGSGLPCDFCRVLVGPGDVEYEVEAQLDGAVIMLRFHYRCHYAWTGGEEPRVAADRA